jgi:cytochrome c2
MFCEENYSAFPNKIDKDTFRKKSLKKKNHLEKYYSNPQYFVRKTTMLFPYDLVLL